ncbi:MAG: class I SAM-dependent methyltransferase, partial [bacterium]|nr:class I SAM-dependent methyltransferase [bacterium]
MPAFTTDYDVFYRWQWFSRDRWRGGFREGKRHSSLGFADLLKERGMAEEPVLDCSCGLGLKTLVMKELGLRVEGSDACAEGIEYARRFAAEEGHPDLAYFPSTWAELPEATEQRYAAVFCDALSWIHEDADMAASLRGLHDVLRPGGVLVYMGALPGSGGFDGSEARLLEEEWQRALAHQGGPYALGYQHTADGVSVTETIVLERGTDYIDKHHLYAVTEDGATRLEAMTMRSVVKWYWDRIEPLLRAAGF